jgi:GntR family transcriptional regulator
MTKLDENELNLSGEGIAYKELAERIRSSIARGDFSDGRQLPTEAELVTRFGLSRQTVRRALQDLVAEGLVFRVRGRGTFVVPAENRSGRLRSVGSIEDILSLSRDAVWITVEPLVLRSHIESASRLRAQSDQVFHGTFTRHHDGRALSVSQIYLPPDVGRKIVDRDLLTTRDEANDRTIVSWVEEVNGSPIAVAQQSITAAPMPDDCAELLGTSTGEPALRIDRLYFDSAGKAVELAVSFFSPDRYTYRIELHRDAVPPTLHTEMLPGD